MKRAHYPCYARMAMLIRCYLQKTVRFLIRLRCCSPLTIILCACFIRPEYHLRRWAYQRLVNRKCKHTPREIWRRFAVHYHRFLATPSGAWLDFQLHEVFGVRKRLSDSTGDRIYDEISEKLGTPEFRPRALFERFGIEVLATTDSAAESTEHHCTIRASGWSGRVVPTFRPDTLFEIASPAWRLELTKLERLFAKKLIVPLVLSARWLSAAFIFVRSAPLQQITELQTPTPGR